jgi:hypothetical protein
MEALDQPWKRETGGCLPGRLRSRAQAEIPVHRAYRGDPRLAVPRRHAGRRRPAAERQQAPRGTRRSFLALITCAAANAAVWIIYDYTHQYPRLNSLDVGILLAIGMTGVIVVLLAEAREWAEALWTRETGACSGPSRSMSRACRWWHVQACKEPPETMSETLDSLSPTRSAAMPVDIEDP